MPAPPRRSMQCSCPLQHTVASPACKHMLQQQTGDLAMPEAQEELANGLVLLEGRRVQPPLRLSLRQPSSNSQQLRLVRLSAAGRWLQC